jgi:hypothetical protein
VNGLPSALPNSAIFAPAASPPPRVAAVNQTVTAITRSAGHGLNFRLTYKVDGKTISAALPIPATIQKAEREVEEFRKFPRFSREFLGTNTEICRLRPLQEESETELKKRRSNRSVKRSRAK